MLVAAFQDLFGHYKEAWESWNSEVARKDEPQQKNWNRYDHIHMIQNVASSSMKGISPCG